MNNEITKDIYTRVVRGATLLDQKAPGWYNRINMFDLDIASCSRCILGQLYSGIPTELNFIDRYYNGESALGITSRTEAAYYGFWSAYCMCKSEEWMLIYEVTEGTDCCMEEEYTVLNTAWQGAICFRREFPDVSIPEPQMV